MDDSEPLRYDVVVLGGALAGASAALLLRRRQPELRVLVIERKTAFDWKVGESTVESSTFFLTRILRLYEHLTREQLSKHGLRYWFHNRDGEDASGGERGGAQPASPHSGVPGRFARSSTSTVLKLRGGRGAPSSGVRRRSWKVSLPEENGAPRA
jgi:choline dehydrogenase-like flavoprotein